uniref:Uncharacterized protein n=1 Tax=Anguilla anguilla TaxID=7936 RepID=A0A0E9UBY6_ANGAN
MYKNVRLYDLRAQRNPGENDNNLIPEFQNTRKITKI